MDLSIIIPVYNVEDYIATCLQSLVLQGFEKEEYEILCIDDGSTDKSVEKIQEFQNKYSEIRLIEQNNSGVSSARNKGIEEAKGKWLFFCDADDFLEVNSLKKIIEIMVEKKVKSASFRYDIVEENANIYFENKIGGGYRTGIKKPFYSGNVWRFIFDRELIINNRIKFNINMTYAEDELFIYHVCRYLDFEKHLYFDDIVYHYRIRQSSLTHKSKYNKLQEHCKSMLMLSEEYKRCLNEKNFPKLLERITYDRYRVAVATVLWDNAMLQEKSSSQIILELKKRELYPYGFCMKLLKIQDLKTMLVNYNKFLFNMSSYYEVFCSLRKLVKK